jgi:hypothetical protein
MRTRQNQFADKLLASKGYIPVLIQLRIEECARIFNNSKHNKPSQGSEYSCGTVVGFLRKMYASVRAYQAKLCWGHIIAERCTGALITDVQPRQSSKMFWWSWSWSGHLGFRARAREYDTAHLRGLITGQNRKGINYFYACSNLDGMLLMCLATFEVLSTCWCAYQLSDLWSLSCLHVQ